MTAVAALLIAGGLAAVGWLIYAFTSAPVMDFDEHTRAALALLTPDDPALPDAELAEAVDALLADLFPTIRPATPEEF